MLDNYIILSIISIVRRNQTTTRLKGATTMTTTIYLVINLYSDGDVRPIFAHTTRKAAEASIEYLDTNFPSITHIRTIKEIVLYND